MRSTLIPAAFAILCFTAPTSQIFSADVHDHHHHHAAPHEGTLVAFGEEAAHLELVLDSTKGVLTGYVLDGEAAVPIRITQPQIQLQISGRDVASTLTVALKAVENPLTGEKTGDSSQFEVTSPALKGKKKFSVTVEDIIIKGVNFKKTKSKFPEGNH